MDVKNDELSKLKARMEAEAAAKAGGAESVSQPGVVVEGEETTELRATVTEAPTEQDTPQGAREMAMKRQEKRGAAPEKLEAYGKAYDKWIEARDFSQKAEADYKKAYTEYLTKESSGVRYFANLPRRMWGLDPKLTPELEAMQNASRNARAKHRQASELLKNEKMSREGVSINDMEKASMYLRTRQPIPLELRKSLGGITVDEVERISTYERMLSHHLVIGVYSKRQEEVRKLFETADKNSLFGKAQERVGRVMGKLKEHKLATAGAVAVGAGVLVSQAPVLAARALVGAGVGILTRGGVRAGLDRTYVESARTNLAKAKNNPGEDYFQKDFEASDKEMASLMGNVGKREARAKTISTAAGILAGGTAAYYAGGMMTGSAVSVQGLAEAGAVQPAEIVSLKPEPVAPAEGPLVEPQNRLVSGGGAPQGGGGPSYVEVSGGRGSDTWSIQRGGLPQGGPGLGYGEGGVSGGSPWQPESTSMLEGGSPLGGPESVSEIDPELEGGEYGHEDLEAGPEITHTVVKGDNAWNIMEGKGMDANPVGGKSEVVTEMSLQDRRYWLDKLFDYCDKHPEFVKEVGAVKSDGNIHIIYPGETLNVSMLDDKIRELMKLEASEVPIPTPKPDEVIAGSGEGLDLNVKADADTSVPAKEGAIANIDDINKLTMKDAYKLYNADDNDPYVIKRMEELGIDRMAFKDMMDSLQSRVPTDESESWDGITIEEYLQNSLSKDEALPMPQDGVQIQRITEVTPYDGVAPRDGDVLVREASFSPEAANDNGEAVRNYVSSIENPEVSFLDRWLFNSSPNIVGTWEAMNPEQMTIGDFKEMVSSPNLSEELANRGLSEAGITKWGETLEAQTKLVPANDNETLAQYIGRVTSGQRAA